LKLTGAAHQSADLMTADGAVVLTKQLLVVGCGVQGYAPHLHLPVVQRVLDATATQQQANNGGTRYRATYRSYLTEPDSLALVVSQYGGVRFKQAQAGQGIFWEQLTL